MELNGYYFRNILKRTRRRFALSAGEQALYQELVDICNDETWRKSFQVSNGELTTALNCNEKTLIGWRQSLINAGLIKYNSGKSKRTFGIYELAVETTVKITANKGTDKGTVSTANKGTNPSDYTKLKETETKRNNSSGGKPPAPKEFDKTIYWEKLVEAWFKFYKSNYQLEPTFNGATGKNLKNIVSRLEKLTKLKGFEWTEDHSVTCLNHFLIKAHKDDWLKRNFLLSNLDSKFDTIVNPKNDGTTKNGKQSTGGDVDVRTAFEKIDILTAASGNSR